LDTENVYKYKYNKIEKAIEVSDQLGLFVLGGVRVEF
jgi:hypothetical protein